MWALPRIPQPIAGTDQARLEGSGVKCFLSGISIPEFCGLALGAVRRVKRVVPSTPSSLQFVVELIGFRLVSEIDDNITITWHTVQLENNNLDGWMATIFAGRHRRCHEHSRPGCRTGASAASVPLPRGARSV